MKWAIKLRRKNRLEGYKEHYLFDVQKGQRANVPVLFLSREAARAYVKECYSYISRRSDLRSEPHGWLAAKVCKVSITLTELQ